MNEPGTAWERMREYDLTVAGRRLRDWRLNQPNGEKVTQREVAQRTGVSKVWVYQTERGSRLRRSPSGEMREYAAGLGKVTRARIAAGFGIPISAIWPDAPELTFSNPSEVPPHREEPTP